MNVSQVPQWNPGLHEVCGAWSAQPLPTGWDAVPARWLVFHCGYNQDIDCILLLYELFCIVVIHGMPIFFLFVNSSLRQVCDQPEGAVQAWHDPCAGEHLFSRSGLQEEHPGHHTHRKATLSLSLTRLNTHSFASTWWITVKWSLNINSI